MTGTIDGIRPDATYAGIGTATAGCFYLGFFFDSACVMLWILTGEANDPEYIPLLKENQKEC
jgi:hypothetical protein